MSPLQIAQCCKQLISIAGHAHLEEFCPWPRLKFPLAMPGGTGAVISRIGSVVTSLCASGSWSTFIFLGLCPNVLQPPFKVRLEAHHKRASSTKTTNNRPHRARLWLLLRRTRTPCHGPGAKKAVLCCVSHQLALTHTRPQSV